MNSLKHGKETIINVSKQGAPLILNFKSKQLSNRITHVDENRQWGYNHYVVKSLPNYILSLLMTSRCVADSNKSSQAIVLFNIVLNLEKDSSFFKLLITFCPFLRLVL